MLATSLWGDLAPGHFTQIDLIAATTNAFNAALIVRRPDHWRNYTIVGVILFAIIGGIAGGVSRDVILGEIPAPLLNPWYLLLSVAAAAIAIAIHYRWGQKFREGIYVFATSLSLPWYAAIGTNAALEHGLPYVSSILVGIIGATAGRYVIDLTCGVAPKQFVRGEWFIGTAVLVSTVYVIADAALGLSIWPATLISFTVGFVFRYTALLRHWEEPEPWMPPELTAGEQARPRIQDQLRTEFDHDDE